MMSTKKKFNAANDKHHSVVELKDENGVVRTIPVDSISDAGFRLFGLSVQQINLLRRFYSESGKSLSDL